MSPPEAKPMDSFTSAIRSSQSPSTVLQPAFCADNKLPPMSSHASPEKSSRILPSPPVSPWTSKHYKTLPSKALTDDHDEAYSARDPLLYPDTRSVSSLPADQPLFSSEPSLKAAHEIVSRHIATHKLKDTVTAPTRDEYLLALSCVSTVGRHYNQNPGAYLKRAREESEEQYWKAKRTCVRPASHVAIAPASAQKQSRKTIKATPTSTPVQRVKRTPKATPKGSPISKSVSHPVKGRLQTPEVRPQGAKRPEDVDYNSLIDYSPPTTTLPPGNPKSLKADWPSPNVLNLSNDPDRHLLHEAELNLAGTLRLTCATYLCSKRRIFGARVQALKIGKEFRKTDAQQACKIDVNKASKLWTAYDKVGWFSPHYFEHLLH
ncbi:MAG: hypothetical protein Q9208_003222 [Pyrenodesmia sp. 3 TL-2023]